MLCILFLRVQIFVKFIHSFRKINSAETDPKSISGRGTQIGPEHGCGDKYDSEFFYNSIDKILNTFFALISGKANAPAVGINPLE